MITSLEVVKFGVKDRGSMGHWVGVSLGPISCLGPFLDFLFLFLSAMMGIAAPET